MELLELHSVKKHIDVMSNLNSVVDIVVNVSKLKLVKTTYLAGTVLSFIRNILIALSLLLLFLFFLNRSYIVVKY